ncbi:Tim10/DDP family zinc finger-domain-containing protein [Amanita rubescens]|nr:Tim10/DDP family zinc finger-domain-containing protein [Amanita rubescens]
MTDFFKPSSPSSDVTAAKESIMNSIRAELSLVGAKELMNKSTEKCFAKCVTKPGSSLSSSEQTCLDRCIDRYFEAFTLVSKAYITRISKERQETM